MHPESLITNARARAGDRLILTKAIGTGVLVAGHRLGEAREEDYRRAIESMKQLNRAAAEVMQKHGVRAATDITGFGLAGHALGMSRASNVTLVFDSNTVPLFPGALELVELGCIPGAAFRNQKWAEPHCLLADVPYDMKMLMFDAQTSGGILMAVEETHVEAVLADLAQAGCAHGTAIGRVVPRERANIRIE